MKSENNLKSKINFSFNGLEILIKFNNKSSLLISFLCIFIIFCGCQKPVPLFFDIDKIEDKDGDGFFTDTDCEDKDPSRYPNAPELFGNGIDNNCNDIKDEIIEVDFASKTLKNKIRETLINSVESPDDDLLDNKITNKEMYKLKNLNASNSKIEYIDGLEYAYNLESIDLSNNIIRDITPLVQNFGKKGKNHSLILRNNKLDKDDCLNIQKIFIRNVKLFIDNELDCHVFMDFDNDGFLSPEDCNDWNYFVNPDAPEIAGDNVDNNCNGQKDENEIVFFKDPNLEQFIQESLDTNGTITNYDMMKLEFLKDESGIIQDLTGIEYASNLKSLLLNNNKNIKDYSQIGFIVSLENLSLRNNDIKKVDFLTPWLINLTSIALDYNYINDISPIINLSNLKTIYLKNNYITSISLLSNLDEVNKLYLDGNHISDINSLIGLRALKILSLSDNVIKDISAIEWLSKLLFVNLDRNLISDIHSIDDNLGIFGKEDNVYIKDNPLEKYNCSYIQSIKKKGVNIFYNLDCSF